MTTTAELVLAHLQAYDLKDKSGGRYRSRSPLRSESDSHSFALYVHPDGEHGMFKDHAGDEQGSLYDLAKLLGIETGPGQTWTSKRTYSGLEDYARAHGVCADVYRTAGWREGTISSRPALIFETLTGTRWRFLDGNKPRWGSKRDYKTCWYGLRRAGLMAAKTGVLVLCNGEPSVVAAQHFGLAAACLTNSGERSDIPPALLAELKESLAPGVKLLVVFDVDKKGQEASYLMASQLRGQGFDAQAIALGLSHDGADLADFCMLWGEAAGEKLSECLSLDAPKHDHQQRKWQIVPRDFLRSLPALKWLIDGEIQDHAVNVLVGPPANGKSFIAIDYACQIAQTENVIYMAGEGEYGLNPRLTAWEYHHQKLTDKHLHICLGAVEIMLEGELSAFLEAVKHLKPKLVIVDTLARAMISGDENNSKDMKAFVAGCSEIMKQLGCAVLLVHHTRKDGDVYRGSNVLEGNVDVMLSCTMNDDVITLKSTKFKDRAASNGKFYRLLPKVIITPDGKQLESAVLIPAEQYEPGEELTQSQTSILRLLSDEDEEYYRKDVIDTLHLPLGTVVNAVKVLKKRGFITGEKNSPYRITEDGRQFLARIESIESRESLYSGNTIERPANTIDSPDSIDSVDSIAPKPLPLRPVNSPFATYQTAAEKKADLAAAYQRGKERALLENQEAV